MEDSIHATGRTVSRAVTLGLVSDSGSVTPFRGEFRYDARDPFAVTAVFRTGAGSVRWTFARDLLCQGREFPSGQGDVHVWPSLDAAGNDAVVIELCSPSGLAQVLACAHDLDSFVDEIVACVPPGSEQDLLDVDGLIAAIFACDAS